MNSRKLSMLAVLALLLTAAVLLVTSLKSNAPAHSASPRPTFNVWAMQSSSSAPFSVSSKEVSVFDDGIYQASHLKVHHGFFVDFHVQCESGASVYLLVDMYTNQQDVYGRPEQINGTPYSSVNLGEVKGSVPVRYTPSTVYDHSYIRVSTLPATSSSASCKVSFIMDDASDSPTADKFLIAS
jgi:hypothetical protein